MREASHMCEVVIGLYCSCINEFFSHFINSKSIMNFTYKGMGGREERWGSGVKEVAVQW